MVPSSPILITGASGFLGGHLTRTLVSHGLSPRVLVRSPNQGEELLGSQVEICRGDLRDAEAVRRAVAGVEVIYHCAAMVKSSGSRADFFDCNVGGTERLLTAALAAGVRKVVHVSSVAVYGPSKKTIVREDDEYDPFPQQRGFYTWSKIEADRLAVQFSKERDLSVAVVRPGIIYGPGAKPFFARLHLSLKDQVHFIIGSPHALLPLVFVDSVVEALLRAGQLLNGRTQVYNIVDGAIIQRDYLQRQAEVMGTRPRVVYLPPAWVRQGALLLEMLYTLLRKGTPALSRYRILRACQSLAYDTTKARKELGWRPPVSLPEGLERTWQWWRDHKEFFGQNSLPKARQKKEE